MIPVDKGRSKVGIMHANWQTTEVLKSEPSKVVMPTRRGSSLPHAQTKNFSGSADRNAAHRKKNDRSPTKQVITASVTKEAGRKPVLDRKRRISDLQSPCTRYTNDYA